MVLVRSASVVFEVILSPDTSRYAAISTQLIDVFLQRCRIQASKCRCRDKAESDERIIKQLTVGNKHKKMGQERLLKKGEDLSLDVATDIARTYEATHITTRTA